LKVTYPNGNWAKAFVVPGGMLTTVDEKTELGFGFAPVVRSLEKRTVELKITRIEPGSSFKEIESMDVSIGSPKTSASSSFKIEVIALTKHYPNDSSTSFRSVGYSPLLFAQCCVNCGGQRICANCAVVTECGCCCANGPCCAFCQ
jgi:hypothetical protein